MSAATRARWLGLATRASDNGIFTKDFQLWTKVAGISPSSFGVMLGGDWLNDERLYPTAEVIQISSNPAFLAPSKRRHVHGSEVFESRCFSPDTKAPTIATSYGSQHYFSQTNLETRGLLSHFVKGDGRARYWHPLELLLMHSFTGQQFLSDTWSVAYKHVGNQISIPHSILMLFNALNLIPGKLEDITLDFFIERLLQEHVTCATMHVTRLSAGLMVSDAPFAILSHQHEFIDNFWSTVTDALPLGLSWSINDFEIIHADPTPTPNQE